MRVGVLFSGGKDSCYALFKAMKEHEIVCLISIISKNKESYMFHTPNINLTKIQARAMEIPIIQYKTEGVKEEELKDLAEAIKEAIIKYNIDGVVTGAIASAYQSKRIQDICDNLKVSCINPLWGKDQLGLLRSMVKDGFKFIITSVSAEGLDKSWLGIVIDEKEVEKLSKIEKITKMNVAFEGGEAETLVVDGPIFKNRLSIEDSNIIMENKNVGKLIVKRVRLIQK
ncbi:MAG: diphthine--ammonia ligase [Candidatus Nanoarchaeia archaeon]|nr:diphthine--ammonia ligase [Candidatus Nanoarchaeia archaeon]